MQSIDVGEEGEDARADHSGPRKSIRPFGHAPEAASADAPGDNHAARLHASLLAMLARDLRAPIATVIMGLSEVSEAFLEPDPGTARLLQLIRRYAERAMATAEDAADLSAIACGTLRSDKARLDLTEAVKSAVSSVLREDTSSGVTVTLDSALAPVYIVGDRPRLERVVAGLVAQAVQRAESSVRLRFRIRRHQAELEIVDDGLDPDLGRIEAMLDVRHAASAPELPWGLAARLAITRDIIAIHQGSVVVSRPHRRRRARGGSRVCVQLPVPKLDASDPEPELSPV